MLKCGKKVSCWFIYHWYSSTELETWLLSPALQVSAEIVPKGFSARTSYLFLSFQIYHSSDRKNKGIWHTDQIIDQGTTSWEGLELHKVMLSFNQLQGEQSWINCKKPPVTGRPFTSRSCAQSWSSLDSSYLGCSEGQNHRITQWFRLEGTLRSFNPMPRSGTP